MLVFAQSRKLWNQCGLSVEDSPLNKLRLRIKCHKIMVFGSQMSLLFSSLIFASQNYRKMDKFGLGYIALQNQWAFLSVSLIVSIHFVEKEIREMLCVCQEIVDRSKNCHSNSFSSRVTFSFVFQERSTMRNIFMKTLSGKLVQ